MLRMVWFQPFGAEGSCGLQLVATANAFVWTFIAMPHLPQDHAVAMRVRRNICYLCSVINICSVLSRVALPVLQGTCSAQGGVHMLKYVMHVSHNKV